MSEQEFQYDVGVMVKYLSDQLSDAQVANAHLRAIIHKMQNPTPEEPASE